MTKNSHTHAVPDAGAHGAEYRIVRRDLVKVFVINAAFLAGILVLFFYNKSSGFLEKTFERYIGL